MVTALSNLRVLSLTCVVVAAGLASGCGKPPAANLTERLWVSDLPTNPREGLSAFVISEIRNRQLGLFYRGSVYRGVHDLFSWTGDDAGRRGKMKLLQDGAVHPVHTEMCEPSRGFDHCILVHGDPTGVVRYQSRKRWALRKKSAEHLDFNAVLDELRDEDADLDALAEATLDSAPTADEG